MKTSRGARVLSELMILALTAYRPNGSTANGFVGHYALFNALFNVGGGWRF